MPASNGDGVWVRRHQIPPPLANLLANRHGRARGPDRTAKLGHVFRTRKPLTRKGVRVCAGHRPAASITPDSLPSRICAVNARWTS